MNFDLTKVYSAETAGELKRGDKVYVSDSLEILKDIVEGDCPVETIESILDQPSYRFKIKRDNYAFAYLIEKVKEEKWRPFMDSRELISTWQKKIGVTARANTMPLMWLRNKESKCIGSISSFGAIDVFIFGCWKYMNDLFEDYEFIDGTPCGVKE